MAALGVVLLSPSLLHAHARHAQVHGRPAKAPNTDEIRDLIISIWKHIEKNHPEYAKGCKESRFPLVWSLDNAAVHRSALRDWDDPDGWRAAAGVPGTIKSPPPWSPDLHQVIEHAHANTITEWTSWQRANVDVCARALAADTGGLSLLYEPIKQAFLRGNPRSSIVANVRRLTHVYLLVLGAGGGYIPRRFS